jgi:hypothetical protein
MKGNKRNMMKFGSDPFYLYAIKDEMIDRLFMDREEEISIAKGLLGMKYEDTAEICAVVGESALARAVSSTTF